MAEPEITLLAGDQLDDPEALAWFLARMNGTEPTPEDVEEFRQLLAEGTERVTSGSVYLAHKAYSFFVKIPILRKAEEERVKLLVPIAGRVGVYA